MEIYNALLIFFDISAVVYAFGLQTNGRKRNQIINISKYTVIFGFILYLIISIYSGEFWLAAYFYDVGLIFATANLLFWIIFKKINVG